MRQTPGHLLYSPGVAWQFRDKTRNSATESHGSARMGWFPCFSEFLRGKPVSQWKAPQRTAEGPRVRLAQARSSGSLTPVSGLQ